MTQGYHRAVNPTVRTLGQPRPAFPLHEAADIKRQWKSALNNLEESPPKSNVLLSISEFLFDTTFLKQCHLQEDHRDCCLSCCNAVQQGSWCSGWCCQQSGGVTRQAIGGCRWEAGCHPYPRCWGRSKGWNKDVQKMKSHEKLCEDVQLPLVASGEVYAAGGHWDWMLHYLGNVWRFRSWWEC